MEMAKVTSKGQITIPISIRRRLGINEGDKILFVNKEEGVMMLNPDTVQGDIIEYSSDSHSSVTSPPLSPAAAASAQVAAPVAASAQVAAPVAASAQVAAPVASSVAAPATPVAAVKVSTPIEPQKRKYIPPLYEPEVERPAAQAGGINLSTLLDDIRSIGSNI